MRPIGHVVVLLGLISGCSLQDGATAPLLAPVEYSPVVVGRMTEGFYRHGSPMPGLRFSVRHVVELREGVVGGRCRGTGPEAVADRNGRFIIPRTPLVRPDSVSGKLRPYVCLDWGQLEGSRSWVGPMFSLAPNSAAAADTMWLECMGHGAGGSPDCLAVTREALTKPPVFR